MTWTCNQCQTLGDDLCYENKESYCSKNHECGWVSSCGEGLFTRLFDRECSREWVCEDKCEQPEGKVLGVWLDDPGCGGTFTVNAQYKEDGNPKVGLAVELVYKTQHQYRTTDSEGKVSASFNYQGQEDAVVKAAGYPDKTIEPRLSDSCEPSEKEEIGGQVLGATTIAQGQVLGASTMAETGAEDAYALLFSIGSLMLSLGLKPYALKKVN
ncbi:hypothetical protein ACFL1M_02350 [Patescibacteria group bacterium]